MERGKKAGYLKEKFFYWKTAKLFAPGHIVGLLRSFQEKEILKGKEKEKRQCHVVEKTKSSRRSRTPPLSVSRY